MGPRGYTETQAIENGMSREEGLHCPECGCPWYGNKNLLGDGYRVCCDCYQEWWTDIKYDSPAKLRELPFICEQNFDALITEMTCKARLKSFLRKTICSDKHFAQRGPIDSGKKCSECERGIKVIAKIAKEIAEKEEQNAKNKVQTS